jgi:orotidine-5'-phosphate decarboxylase
VVEAFAARFSAVRAQHGPLVWGLDPSRSVLASWGLGDSPDGLDRFVDVVIEAAVGTVGIVKPQAAFYERHGWRGMRTLTRLVTAARDSGLLVILDAKRGDVGSTNDAYAEAYLGRGGAIEVDALTVHPYLGLQAMSAFVRQAHEAGRCLLVVTRSSNPEGRAVQAAIGPSGSTVEQTLLEEIGQLNAMLARGEIGPIGAVVAPTPTTLEPGLDLLAGHCLFLAPGLGVQGATPQDVARTFAACPERVMPSASRSLLRNGPDIARLREDVALLASELRDLGIG